MDTLIVHVLTSLLYASVLFLIAGGLSLIYGVMRIVNLAHGNLYAFGAYVSAWAVGVMATRWPTGGALRAPAAGRGGRGRTRRHPRADPAAALLPARGGVPAPRHLRPAPDPRRSHALPLGAVPALREPALRGLRQPHDRRDDLSELQPDRHRRRRPRGRRHLGLRLQDAVRRDPARDFPEHAHGLRAGHQRQPCLRPGLHARMLHGRARRGHHRAEPGRGARHGRGRPHHGLRGGGDRRSGQPRGRARRRLARRRGARDRHHALPGDRAGRPLPHGGRGAPDPARRDSSDGHERDPAAAVPHAGLGRAGGGGAHASCPGWSSPTRRRSSPTASSWPSRPSASTCCWATRASCPSDTPPTSASAPTRWR